MDKSKNVSREIDLKPQHEHCMEFDKDPEKQSLIMDCCC